MIVDWTLCRCRGKTVKLVDSRPLQIAMCILVLVDAAVVVAEILLDMHAIRRTVTHSPKLKFHGSSFPRSILVTFANKSRENRACRTCWTRMLGSSRWCPQQSRACRAHVASLTGNSTLLTRRNPREDPREEVRRVGEHVTRMLWGCYEETGPVEFKLNHSDS